jgi:cell division GTPase FtsZ
MTHCDIVVVVVVGGGGGGLRFIERIFIERFV